MSQQLQFAHTCIYKQRIGPASPVSRQILLLANEASFSDRSIDQPGNRSTTCTVFAATFLLFPFYFVRPRRISSTFLPFRGKHRKSQVNSKTRSRASQTASFFHCVSRKPRIDKKTCRCLVFVCVLFLIRPAPTAHRIKGKSIQQQRANGSC